MELLQAGVCVRTGAACSAPAVGDRFSRGKFENAGVSRSAAWERCMTSGGISQIGVSSPPRRLPLLSPWRSSGRRRRRKESIASVMGSEPSMPTAKTASDAVREEPLKDEEEASQGLTKLIIAAERGFNVLATEFVVKILEGLYSNRYYARFYVLETIARVPYFAFVSVLHLYESFGWWRRSDYLKIHFAESWNELHHLLVMEALGGDERWFDRFLAQHIAVGYYFLTTLMYLLSPRMAYHFSECVEKHAFKTYDKYINSHGEELKKQPAPEVAIQYYTKGDLYMFDEFQTDQVPFSRRPKIENLYDVFVNIREDEAQHCKTMQACQTGSALRSPHEDVPLTELGLLESDRAVANCEGILECAITATSFADRARKRLSSLNGDELLPNADEASGKILKSDQTDSHLLMSGQNRPQ